eukprot:758704-Hanusia_phi.AAC.1
MEKCHRLTFSAGGLCSTGSKKQGSEATTAGRTSHATHLLDGLVEACRLRHGAPGPKINRRR